MEPESVKVMRDVKDFDGYGGTLAPRPMSVSGTPGATVRQGPVGEREHKADQFDFSGTQHRWVNRDMTQTAGYQTLSDGFKRVFDNARPKSVVLPVVGYRGFMPGYQAQNMHGKAFRELAVQSKRFEILTQKRET